MWERRYTVVVPSRSASGTRLYGAEDVGRLTLIKRLVERGDAISSVANLTLAQLRERVSGADLAAPEPGPIRPVRLAVLGAGLAGRLREEVTDAGGLEGLAIIGLFDRPEPFLTAVAADTPDLVLFDYPTVHADQVREIGHLLAQSGATRAILVYHFADRTTLERLDARRITTLRAPVDLRNCDAGASPCNRVGAWMRRARPRGRLGWRSIWPSRSRHAVSPTPNSPASRGPRRPCGASVPITWWTWSPPCPPLRPTVRSARSGTPMTLPCTPICTPPPPVPVP